MKIHNLGTEILADLHELYKLNLDEIWYFYEEGYYDGSGQMLVRKGQLFDIFDLSHNSCSYPLEDATFNGQSLEELFLSLSNEYKAICYQLFEMVNLRKDLIWLSGTYHPTHFIISMFDSGGKELTLSTNQTPFGEVQYDENVGYLNIYGTKEMAEFALGLVIIKE
jgi:hypothetical protein